MALLIPPKSTSQTVSQLVQPLWATSLPYAVGPLSVCPVCNIGVLWPNGWTNQDETWIAGRPQLWPRFVVGTQVPIPQRGIRRKVGLNPNGIVLDGTQLPSPKRGQSPLIFGPCLLWPNGCMDLDATWYGGRPRPSPRCARWGPSSPSPKKGALPPNFQPIFVVVKRLDGSRCHLVRW